jgi:hypothetical protein
MMIFTIKDQVISIELIQKKIFKELFSHAICTPFMASLLPLIDQFGFSVIVF